MRGYFVFRYHVARQRRRARRADEHHPAAAEWQLDGLVSRAGLLEDLVEAGDADVGGPVLDVHRHVAVLDEDPLQIAAVEDELARL